MLLEKEWERLFEGIKNNNLLEEDKKFLIDKINYFRDIEKTGLDMIKESDFLDRLCQNLIKGKQLCDELRSN